jgi:hypothetical protein
MEPALLYGGIGFPLANGARAVGYGFLQSSGVLIELVFIFEYLT